MHFQSETLHNCARVPCKHALGVSSIWASGSQAEDPRLNWHMLSSLNRNSSDMQDEQANQLQMSGATVHSSHD